MNGKQKIILFISAFFIAGLVSLFFVFSGEYRISLIPQDHTWSYSLEKITIDKANNDFFSQINWEDPNSSDKISIPENKKDNILFFKTEFNVKNLSNIQSLLVTYNYKFSTKIFLNGKEVLNKDRNLITANKNIKQDTILPTIDVFEFWTASNAIINYSKTKELLENGGNSIIIAVYNLKDISSFKANNIKIFANCNGFKPFKNDIIKIEKPAFTFSKSNLPIFVLNTYNSVIPDEPKIEASLNIMEGKKENSLSDLSSDYKIKIERRGFTSQSFSKKSYGFNLYDANMEKLSTSLCGLPEARKWILYGPYADKSLIRNALTYTLYRKMGNYAPKHHFVNLVINNNYQGIYMLTEKINTDANHLNIPKLNINKDNIAKGGYLLEIDRSKWQSNYPPKNDTSAIPLKYEVYSPKIKNLSPTIIQKIQTQFNTFEKTIYENSADKYDYFDINSFVDYFIISELTKNIDAYRLSTFLYNKDISAPKPKFYLGPIWDYNFAYGLTDYNDGYNPEGFVYTSTKYVPFWWNKLMYDKVFTEKLEERYFALRKTVLSNKNIINNIDSLADICKPSGAVNFKKWPVLNSTDFWPNYYLGKTYDDEIDYIKKWISKRLFFLDNSILAKHKKDINYYEVSIRNNKEWMEKIKEKASKRNISIGEMILIDAKHMAKKEK